MSAIKEMRRNPLAPSLRPNRSIDRHKDELGINMVDLMMWLVIAALLLAAAIQGIGYYQKAALVYQLSSDVSAAGQNVMRESSLGDGKVTEEVVEKAIEQTEFSSEATDIRQSTASDGYFVITSSHPDARGQVVVYSSESRNGLVAGVNIIPEGVGVPGVFIPEGGAPINGQCSDGQWKAEYFDNYELAGEPVGVRCEGVINHNWGMSAPDVPGMPIDSFSIRWSTSFTADETSEYKFNFWGEDRSRVILDGTNLGGKWDPSGPGGHHEARSNVTAGEHDLVLEYREQGGGASSSFTYGPVG